ncbi:MAG TPA: D-alanyl-D-alanine carboxypeptidase family protein [Thermohalobaculum sp.]|nr:D-alanyl-D-alanine carboxypeptidase family protein [Thermohalobaculum sp.]
MRVALVACMVLTGSVQIALGEVQTTPARAAIVIDMTSGAVLLEKDADLPIPPASMSKLMTLEVVFDALKSGLLSLEDTFRISERAAAMAGSKMFIRSGELVSVENLLRGVIVQSGNDAAVALAEAMSGTEEAFAGLMNRRAADIGLTGSHFANATGWPDPLHRMTPRDLATLAERVITQYPQQYPIFAETKFTWDGITQSNRNPLLSIGNGTDGLKTGHTEEAGYGLVASAKQGDRRILLVVTGLESTQQRSQEGERLINWAFRAFETKRLYTAGEPVAEAEVWIGAVERVTLAPVRDLIVTVPAGVMEKAEITVHFSEPVEAPIEAGAELGRLEVLLPDVSLVSVPLVAVEAVERGGVVTRLEAAARLLVHRLLQSTEG